AKLSDETLRLWEVETGQLRYSIRPHATGRWLKFVLSPDGRHVATWNDENPIVLWRLGSERGIGRLPIRAGRVGTVAFSPDGKRWATANADTTVLIWDIADLIRP